MSEIILSKKEYQKLLKLKKELDQILRKIQIKEKKLVKGSKLLDLAELKIKGGPKDLSEKIDFFLYEQ